MVTARPIVSRYIEEFVDVRVDKEVIIVIW